MKKKKLTITDRVTRILVALVILTAAFLAWRRGYFVGLSSGLKTVQKATARTAYDIKDSFKAIAYLKAARENVQRNNRAIIDLQAELQMSKDENERLKKFLALKNFREYGGGKRIFANVIGGNTDGYIRYYIIDRGFDDGLSEGDGVIGRGGVLGRISRVDAGTAAVQLLTDTKSSISVRDERSRVVGILNGSGNNVCEMNYVPKEEDISVGDLIITSGLNRAFPGGIRVGTVTHVEKKNDGLSLKIKVRPYVNTFAAQEVFIIKGGQE